MKTEVVHANDRVRPPCAVIRRRCGLLGVAAGLAFGLLPAPRLEAQIKERVPLTPFHVRLKLKAKADLSAVTPAYALMPGGKHVGLSYTGVKDAKTIEHYTQLGFRTSIAVYANTPEEEIKTLKAAGADLILSGTIGPEQPWTPQEGYDGATMPRWTVIQKGGGPAAVANYHNARNSFELPVRRAVGCYLYAIHDSNYLGCNSWAPGYQIMVGRNRTPEMIVRPYGANPAGVAPNTIIYYQTVATILEGLLAMVKPGELTTIQLRDFAEQDRAEVDRYIAPFGKNPKIWHTSQQEICGYAYLKEKSRIGEMKPVNDMEADLNLAIEKNAYLPFCLAPLTLRFPKDFPLESARMGAENCPVTVTDEGVFVDVPVSKAFRAGCEMSLDKPPSMTIPEEMPVTLTLKNTSDKPLENFQLQWSRNVGTEVAGDAQGTLAPGEERRVKAVVRTIAGPRLGVFPEGARFGLVPLNAIVTGTVGGEPRTYAASWEVMVAPRLRVEADPRVVPIPKGESFPIFVHLANGKVDTTPGWAKPSDAKLIDYRTGACKGTVRFALREGLEAVPPEQPFELSANGHATVQFLIKCHAWTTNLDYLVPQVRFEGEKDPIELPWYGTEVARTTDMEYQPLDEKGLLAYASWDDKANTRANLDRAAGSIVQSCPGASGGGSTPSPEGVKRWCIAWNSNVAFDAFKNIDSRKGTVMFWWRRDPRVRNEIRVENDPQKSWQTPPGAHNYGEQIFFAGINRDMALRRFPKVGSREGYMELLLADMPVRGRPTAVHYTQAALETDKLFQWRHIAIVWDIKERRLELYFDGALAGRAEKEDKEWLVLPFDPGKTSHDIILIETHHGHWSGSLRDELYIYNRPLTGQEIKENMALAKAAGTNP